MPASTETAVDPREDKLPKWARDEFASLRRQLVEAERYVADAKLSQPADDSDTLLDPYRTLGAIGLGNRPHIRFLAGETRYDYLDVRTDGEGKERIIEVRGSQGVTLRPTSSNVVQIALAP